MMTAAVIIAIVAFGGLQDADTAILFGFGFGGLFVGVFILPMLRALFGEGPKLATLLRMTFLLVFGLIWISITFNFAHGLLVAGLSESLPALRAFVEHDPFPFVLVAAFAALNGIFST